MTIVYFDSRTGNVSRFIDKVKAKGVDIEAIKIKSGLVAHKMGHLVTYTDRDGEIPKLTHDFLTNNNQYLLSVSSSGNMNWGRTYGLAADRISNLYKIPIAVKFELSGLDTDVQDFVSYVKSIPPTKSEHIL